MVSRILFLTALLVALQSLQAQGIESRIMVDQVGYYPRSIKIALVPECDAGNFQVLSQETGNPVFEGKLQKAVYWEFSGDKVHVADFSDLTVPGEYIVSCPGEKFKDSYPFSIGNSVYHELAQSTLHSFYLNRMSTVILEDFAGVYARPEANPDTVVLIHASAASKKRPEGSVISSPGGWYDAGDYNKYVVNSGITTYTLLELFEISSSLNSDIRLNIPEKGNDLPDLLDEILWNLRWMMSMQDPNDGGVYHKLTHKRFTDFKMPHEIDLARYVVMKTTGATLDLAAVCARAERIFRDYEKQLPGFADSCRLVAERAWAWAVKNPDVPYVQPADINTGAYGEFDLKDEWTWASIEMFISSGDPSYLPGDLEDQLEYDVPEWRRVGTLGIYSLLDLDQLETEQFKGISEKFIHSAEELSDRYASGAYRVSLNTFPWGSNGEASNQGIFLLKAYLISGDKKFYEAAEATLHYILGRNPMNYCWVTGTGTKFPRNIHDRRSGSDGIEGSLPGLLAGGPTKDARRDCGEAAYLSDFPAKSYLDEQCSYSTNEWAINWNAALAMLVNALEILNETEN